MHNPIRSEPRRKSDIAHELSHHLLEHDLTEIREVAGVPFRTCRADQEEEATNLGGTLLLPRPLLLRAVARGMGPDEVAADFGVTIASIHRIVVLVHGRTQATSDLALADAPSFADVLPQWNSRRDLEAARLERPAVAQRGAVEHRMVSFVGGMALRTTDR